MAGRVLHRRIVGRPGRGFKGGVRAGLDMASMEEDHRPMARPRPRVAVRAIILHEDRLLLVNAYRHQRLALWGAPGGGVEAGHSLPDNLMREMHEETGLRVKVAPTVALVNEFHDPAGTYHQVDIFFRCTIIEGEIAARWTDPEGIVTERRFFSREELTSGAVLFKPDSLVKVAWGGTDAPYDPLEPILR